MAPSSIASERLDTKAVCLFYAVAFSLNWLLMLPVWLSRDGLQATAALWLLPLIMFTPAAGVIAVRFFLPQSLQPILRVTGLGIGRWPSCIQYWLFSWFGITAMTLAAPFVGAILGMYKLDLQGFSGFAQLLSQQPGAKAALENVSRPTLLVIQFTQLLIAPGINAIFAFGEEWGWRGLLLPKLLPLGQGSALILTGALWGLWRMPQVLLGYNYPSHSLLGTLWMIVFCAIIGVILGWTRLATGSIWPAVIGHGALNAGAGFGYIFADSSQTIDTLNVSIVGWTGWILPLLTILLLIALKRLPVSEPH